MNKFKVIVLVLISLKTFACLNGETKELKNGVMIYMDYRGVVPHGHNFVGKKYYHELIVELENLYKKTKDLDYLSDVGYILIIEKKYQEALKLYLEIEKIKPNRYSTASNIGTLYELMGENKKAYKWIKKSISINPESHEGSEWLHLKILEAKIKDLKDVSSQFLINTTFGEQAVPKSKLSKEELEKLSKSIYYQLNERMTFIKPEDKVNSVLLFELGNIVKLINSNKEAIKIYNISKDYGFRDEIINKRLLYCYQFEIKYCEDRNHRLYDGYYNLKDRTNGIDFDYVSQIETTLLILSIVVGSLLIVLIVLYLKWKKLKDNIFFNKD
jgi:tetratricopeptide (TPR) repeat protein